MTVHHYWAMLLSRGQPERGASLVEYSLLIALIAMVCFSAVSYMGGETVEVYSQIGTSLN